MGGKAIGTHYIWNNNVLKRVWFRCPHCHKKGRKEPDIGDLKLIEETNRRNIEFWFPKNELLINPRININRRIKISEPFSHRNLYALALLYNEIEKINDTKMRNFFKFVFTSMLPQTSNMVLVIRRRGKVKETKEVGSWIASYWVPREHFEIDVWHAFSNRS